MEEAMKKSGKGPERAAYWQSHVEAQRASGGQILRNLVLKLSTKMRTDAMIHFETIPGLQAQVDLNEYAKKVLTKMTFECNNSQN
jgi:predicted ester cyclase